MHTVSCAICLMRKSGMRRCSSSLCRSPPATTWRLRCSRCTALGARWRQRTRWGWAGGREGKRLACSSPLPCDANSSLTRTCIIDVCSAPAAAPPSRQIRESIKSLFPDRDCFTLVRPVNDEDELARLDELPSGQMRPEFRRASGRGGGGGSGGCGAAQACGCVLGSVGTFVPLSDLLAHSCCWARVCCHHICLPACLPDPSLIIHHLLQGGPAPPHPAHLLQGAAQAAGHPDSERAHAGRADRGVRHRDQQRVGGRGMDGWAANNG